MQPMKKLHVHPIHLYTLASQSSPHKLSCVSEWVCTLVWACTFVCVCVCGRGIFTWWMAYPWHSVWHTGGVCDLLARCVIYWRVECPTGREHGPWVQCVWPSGMVHGCLGDLVTARLHGLLMFSACLTSRTHGRLVEQLPTRKWLHGQVACTVCGLC